MTFEKRSLVAAFWVATVSAAALSACSSPSEKGRTETASADGERLVIQSKAIDNLCPVSGTYATRDQADARARISGTLVELRVREGDLVKRGQVIAVIRDDRIGLQTAAMDAQVAAAGAEAVRAQSDLARTRDLFEHGVYAKARLEQVEAGAKSANAQLSAAKAQRAASADLASQGQVLAPATGVVLHASVPAGSVVTPGQSIATITAGPSVVRFTLPEAQTHAIKVGQLISMSPDGATAPARAPVLQIYPDATSGEITIDLAAPKDMTGPIGSRVDVSVPVGSRSAIVAPTRFISRRYGVDYVRVLRRDGVASEVVVQTGSATGAPNSEAQTEILAGLAPGDVILGPGARK